MTSKSSDIDKTSFTFNISLSILNHLGRNLYRSFATVLGEAISNSWDANANTVRIYIDKRNNNLVIKDDGDGMNFEDFQNKFLKIGYSKRKDGTNSSPGKGRPYIGRKGIGKLAMLSCSKKISVISKRKDSEYIGGTIDNSGLDKAIDDDLTPSQYSLAKINLSVFKKYIKDHKSGTIIYFENINEGIRSSLEFLRKTIALYFRFSLIDKSFNIFLEDEKITLDDLKDLAANSEFIWLLNDLDDPYVNKKLINLKKTKKLSMPGTVRGFISSVNKPRDLKIMNTGEKVSVDLFVNGRLRERDILKYIPTARVVEDYLYGQIHFDELDEGKDRFATSREGIIANDPKFQELLDQIKNKVMPTILVDWDTWRIERREDGDSENDRIKRKDRKAGELFNAVSEEYTTPKTTNMEKPHKVDEWIDDLAVDAQYNFTSYADCFISENLIRRHIQDNKIIMTPEAIKQVAFYKDREIRSKGEGNISIDIRRIKSDLTYLAMDDLANLVDKTDSTNKSAGLSRDAKEYKPMRDAVMHTSLLTDVAKAKLKAVYENIKARLRTLLSTK